MVAVSLILLGVCTNIKAVSEMIRSTDHFIALDENPAIRYEPGAREYALLISNYFDRSVQIVEARQEGFKGKVLVFVPNTFESFEKYCANPVRACVMGGRLFMSAQANERKKNIKGIFTHELSHVQFYQYVGHWNTQLPVPGWFGEGLTVYVSDDGGAEKVTRQQAIDAVLTGNSIKPTETGGLLFPHSGIRDTRDGQMFYQQSVLFVEWLYTRDLDNFRHVIELLRAGKTLDEAMMEAYGFSVKVGWKQYLSELKHKQSHSRRQKKAPLLRRSAFCGK